MLRAAVQHWPSQRGRGRLINTWRRCVPSHSALAFEIGAGAFVHLELDDYMVQWAFVGDHDRDLDYRASLELIEPAATVIDVGANIGLWSLVAARRAGCVHAFEPAPSTFARLRRNLDLNGMPNVVANRLAVDREGGTTSFYEAIESNSGGAGYLRRPGAPVEVTVERVTLDDYCRSRGIERVGVLKLDIEGAEWLALQGAEELLGGAAPPAIFMELDGELTRQFGWEPVDVLAWLRERDYRTWHAEPGGRLTDVAPGVGRDVIALHASWPL